jgi:uncharacterized LabA/DUF88 family protein
VAATKNTCAISYQARSLKLPETDKSLEKVGIFVDVQNIYYTCRQALNGKFDYNKFWAKVTHEREVVCAYAYATDRGDPQQAQFQNILRAIGFDVQLKTVLKRVDGTAKADWDVGIALDVYEAAEKCDTIVLASGDGDFGILLDRIRERFRTQSEVYGVRALTSNQLIGPASRFIDIDKKLLLD